MICPKCMREIATENVNMQHMAAKCDYCKEIFSFAGNFPDSQWNQPDRHESPPPPKPSWLNVEQYGNRLVMSYKWPAAHLFLLIPFTIAWNGFLVGWYALAINLPGIMKFIMMIFPIAHLAAGIFMLHQCLTGLFNRTTVTVDGNMISIRNGPIPSGGNCSIPVRDIEQLFCRGKTRTDSDGDSHSSYSLHALLRDGLRRDLLSGQTDRDMVLYMEWMIENHLNIENRPVAGELGSTQG